MSTPSTWLVRVAGLVCGLFLAIVAPTVAAAAEPVPFTAASAPCSSSTVNFPVQGASPSDAIFKVRSIAAEGWVEGGSSGFPASERGRFFKAGICAELGRVARVAMRPSRHGSNSTGRARPPIAKACAAIRAGGRRLRVDITETIGRGPGSCGTARTVMRRFLRRHPTPYSGPNSSQVRFRGRKYGCYVSRPDGEGWDYHCSWSSTSGGEFVDYGAGRRF
jgi:hypothetical protein